MREFCVKKGISYHLTVPHTPPLKGVPERMIRTIAEKASFWVKAVLTATYLVNWSPNITIEIMKKHHMRCGIKGRQEKEEK